MLKKLSAIVGSVVLASSTIISPLLPLVAEASNEETYKVIGKNNELTSMTKSELDNLTEFDSYKVKGYNIVNQVQDSATPSKRDKYVVLNYDLDDYYDKGGNCYTKCPPETLFTAVQDMREGGERWAEAGQPALPPETGEISYGRIGTVEYNAQHLPTYHAVLSNEIEKNSIDWNMEYYSNVSDTEGYTIFGSNFTSKHIGNNKWERIPTYKFSEIVPLQVFAVKSNGNLLELGTANVVDEKENKLTYLFKVEPNEIYKKLGIEENSEPIQLVAKYKYQVNSSGFINKGVNATTGIDLLYNKYSKQNNIDGEGQWVSKSTSINDSRNFKFTELEMIATSNLDNVEKKHPIKTCNLNECAVGVKQLASVKPKKKIGSVGQSRSGITPLQLSKYIYGNSVPSQIEFEYEGIKTRSSYNNGDVIVKDIKSIPIINIREYINNPPSDKVLVKYNKDTVIGINTGDQYKVIEKTLYDIGNPPYVKSEKIEFGELTQEEISRYPSIPISPSNTTLYMIDSIKETTKGKYLTYSFQNTNPNALDINRQSLADREYLLDAKTKELHPVANYYDFGKKQTYSIKKIDSSTENIFDFERKLGTPFGHQSFMAIEGSKDGKNYPVLEEISSSQVETSLSVVNIFEDIYNVSKEWQNSNGEKIAPPVKEIQVNVFNNGVKVDTLTLSESNDWKSSYKEYPFTLKEENFQNLTANEVTKKMFPLSEEDINRNVITFEEVKVPNFDTTITVTNELDVTIVNKETPNTCTNFTVNVNENDSDVKITSKDNTTFFEGKVVDGKVVTDKPLVVGEEYTIEVTKDGFVTQTVKHTAVKNDCETTITISETPNTCTNFTVNVNENGSNVKITDEKGTIFYEGKVTNNKVVTDKPLVVGEKYNVEVTKNGYSKNTLEVTAQKDDCEITLNLVETPNTCTNFTVNVNEENANVKITDEKGTIFYEGKVTDKKVVTNKPLVVGKEYTVTVTKDGYITETKTIVSAKDDCETTIILVEKPNTCANFTVITNINGSVVKITSKDNATFFEGKVTNGKVVTDKPLVVGEEYTITVSKEGYVTETIKHTAVKDNCETTITISETPNTCTNFTVEVNEENAKVVITDSKDKVFYGNTVTNGKVVTDKPLVVGEEYTITVSKEGYVTETLKYTPVKDECVVNVTINENPNVCTDFTVNVNVEGANVKITTKDDKIFYEGIVVNGKVITDKPLAVGETYTIKVTKDNYVTKSVEHIAVKDMCATTISLDKKPTAPTPPVSPNKCETFTVKIENKQGATVELKEKYTNLVIENMVIQNNQVTFSKPLGHGKTYIIEFTHDGIKTAKEIIGDKDTCEITLEDIVTPPVVDDKNKCENFTVITNKNNVTVQIKDSQNNVVSEGKSTDNKYVYNRPLLVGETYTIVVLDNDKIIGEKDVTIEKDICETTITIEEPKEENKCENHTITLNQENTEVVVTENGKEIFNGKVTNDKIIFGKPFDSTKEYEVTVSKSGYNVYNKKITIKDGQCVTEIKLTKKPSSSGGGGGHYVCPRYEVETSIANTIVKIYKNDKLVEEGKTDKDGHYVIQSNLEYRGEYTYKFTKDGYTPVTVTKEVNAVDCLVSVTMEKETTPTPPKPVKTTKPYNPDEEPVEEEKPTPVPPVVEEKPVPPVVEEKPVSSVEEKPVPPIVVEKPNAIPPTTVDVVQKPIIESTTTDKEIVPPTIEIVEENNMLEQPIANNLPQTNTTKSYTLAIGIMLTIVGVLLLVVRNRKLV